MPLFSWTGKKDTATQDTKTTAEPPLNNSNIEAAVRRANKDKTQEEIDATNAKIDQQANPDPESHNFGQPIRASLDNDGNQRTKLATDCKSQQQDSLQCIMDNYERREVCQPFFEAYKACRRREREERLEKNAQRGSFW